MVLTEKLNISLSQNMKGGTCWSLKFSRGYKNAFEWDPLGEPEWVHCLFLFALVLGKNVIVTCKMVYV